MADDGPSLCRIDCRPPQHHYATVAILRLVDSVCCRPRRFGRKSVRCQFAKVDGSLIANPFHSGGHKKVQNNWNGNGSHRWPFTSPNSEGSLTPYYKFRNGLSAWKAIQCLKSGPVTLWNSDPFRLQWPVTKLNSKSPDIIGQESSSISAFCYILHVVHNWGLWFLYQRNIDIFCKWFLYPLHCIVDCSNQYILQYAAHNLTQNTYEA